MSSDKFIFYSKSSDAKPGKGKVGKSLQEDKNTAESYPELENIEDWRRILSNFSVCDPPFEFNGKHFYTAEHAFHYAKFLVTDHIDKANSFTVESKSSIGLEKDQDNISRVKSAGGKGTTGLKLNAADIATWEKNRPKWLKDILAAKFTQCNQAQKYYWQLKMQNYIMR